MYDLPNSDDLDPSSLSLCLFCAKDKHLKRFVVDNIRGSALCGICLSPSSVGDTCRIERKRDLTNLIRALVRYYFDESDYNPRWGGEDGPHALLYRENPIVEHRGTLFHMRSKKSSFVFLEDLFNTDPYPDPETGISIYAGSDKSGARLAHRAISRAENSTFSELRLRLCDENYFNVEPELQVVFNKAGNRITRTILAGTTYYRARIGAIPFVRRGEGSLAYKPYEASELGAPRAPKASSGRLNRAGVAFLYLCNRPKHRRSGGTPSSWPRTINREVRSQKRHESCRVRHWGRRVLWKRERP